MSSVCPIGSSDFRDRDRKTHIGARGLQNSIETSVERGDRKHETWCKVKDWVVHEECR